MVQQLGVGGQVVQVGVVVFVGSAHLDRVKLVQGVEAGYGDAGQAVQLGGVVAGHGVEPAHPAGASRDGAVLAVPGAALLPQEIGGISFDLGGERPRSDACLVRL